MALAVALEQRHHQVVEERLGFRVVGLGLSTDNRLDQGDVIKKRG